MFSLAVDTVFGWFPLWVWIVAGCVLAAAVFGIIRIYAGSWSVALGGSLLAGAALLLAGSTARGRNQGRAAERERNEQAARKRAGARKERNDEISALDAADLDRRLDRFVRDDETGQRSRD